MSCTRVAFVTGASRGIGRAIADTLAAANYKVAFGYNKTKIHADSLANNLNSIFPVHVDVADEHSVQCALACIESELGNVDILVNNAGIAKPKPFLDLTDHDWEEMLSVNLLGAVRCSRLVLPSMLQNRFGRIVNITSIGGQWGGMYQVHYAAAKAALINLTMSLAKLYSMHGITTNAVAPGLIDTDMISEEMKDKAAVSRIQGIPVGRLGTVQEVASTVLFLCSADAGYVTGQTINVNGGMYFG
ncbi:MAG: 3-oxoacyl-ACP reductase family protein [Candidatus Planktophila sp.]